MFDRFNQNFQNWLPCDSLVEAVVIVLVEVAVETALVEETAAVADIPSSEAEVDMAEVAGEERGKGKSTEYRL